MHRKINTILYLLFVSVLALSVGCSPAPSEKSAEPDGRFDELFRPQYHFSPPSQWMNDPNGMVYHAGEYHLFYQHYPDSNVWGAMHWGHAVSEDLVHWEHLPIAIAPDSLGWIFSGSAVLDETNSSGLGTADNPPLVAIYTYHDPVGAEAGREDYQTQGIAYSTDGGRNWTKYAGNPVLENPGIRDFRDPKVAWIGERWIMSLAVKDRIRFYSSDNLLEWTYESDFQPEWAAYGGVWECPDLFPLTTPEGEEKWILFVSINPGGPNGGSATQYFVGDFDGSTFTSESDQVKWLDYGADNYAGVTWSNVPKSDGRRLFIGWMSNWTYANVVPTENWRSANTLPRELALVRQGETYRVRSSPVAELEKLRKSSSTKEGDSWAIDAELSELLLFPEAGDFSLELSNDTGERIILAKKGDQLTFDRSQSGITGFSEAFTALHTAPLHGMEVNELRVFLDRSSVEIFVNQGALVLSEIVFPEQPYSRIRLTGFKSSHQVHELASIW
ncbi:glycoside hydrolase family 32 protein [Cyclobacterium xiamenense]|uniref:glycoside hydrolase family 32 protein n=1 Tax=Cyclobacterium xiamenense TaxID=1297121 RepID=UPI0012B97D53|nr:glycoside hydrolase family 32 protein [Cyclobacterium xiamenense]